MELVFQPSGKRAPYRVKIDVVDLPVYRRSKGWHRHDKGLIRYPSKAHHRGSILLHRAILKLPPDLYVVFGNGNSLDVRRSNMKVITAREQRNRLHVPRRPYIITRTYKDTPTGVSFHTGTLKKKNGKRYEYRFAMANFCHRGKEQSKRAHIAKYGLHEATRIVLAWRVEKIREHGLKPNRELLDMLARVTRMVRAGGGHDELFGGNAEYENARVAPWEVHHAFDNNRD